MTYGPLSLRSLSERPWSLGRVNYGLSDGLIPEEPDLGAMVTKELEQGPVVTEA